MKSSRFIVITTIHPPTAAVRAFRELPDYRLIVVGDRKTPGEWHLPGADYFSLEDQMQSDYRSARSLPVDHYARKNLGYLEAIAGGAESIIDTDDDNYPKKHWQFPPFEGRFPSFGDQLGFINVYRHYSGRRIWPRGLPLSRIDAEPGPVTADKAARVGVWQGLADGDPDVDAIYRLVIGELCTFADAGPCILPLGTFSPFNSQNTAFRRSVFPLLYLPATVTFRYTDILRGLVAQPILHAHGFRLGFIGPTVRQERNPHDLMQDFVSEIPVYLHAERVLKTVSEAISAHSGIDSCLVAAYRALAAEKIVQPNELSILDDWLHDLAVVFAHADTRHI